MKINFIKVILLVTVILIGFFIVVKAELDVVQFGNEDLLLNCGSFDQIDRLCFRGVGIVDDIHGFSYDPQYRYKLVVLTIPTTGFDSSPTRFLILVLNKEPDLRNKNGFYSDEGVLYAEGKIDRNTYNRCTGTKEIINCWIPYYHSVQDVENSFRTGYIPINYISGFTYAEDTTYGFTVLRTRSASFGQSGFSAKFLWYDYKLIEMIKETSR